MCVLDREGRQMDSAAISLMTALIEAGNIDTVHRDVYLDRARTFLAPVVSLEDFRRLERERAALAELPVTIGRALDRADWPLVKALSQRAQALQHATEEKGELLQTARTVYDVGDVRLDPFSPGLHRFTRIPRRDLATLRTRVLDLLGTLQGADGPWKDFYAARRAAFQAQPKSAWEEEADVATSSTTDAVQSARQALTAGDMKRLATLADVLATQGAPGETSSSPAANVGSRRPDGEPGRGFEPARYSSETLARARRLGLASRHLEPRLELASLRRYAWTPLSDSLGHIAAPQVSLPPGVPEGLQDGLEMFMIHPLVNSGGARYLPSLVAEDVLVEDFPDPAEGQTAPVSELVKRLTLPGRRGLPRIAIEQALLMHGARILEEDLGLDPRVFRLVCIPPDVYVRLGEAEGWGRQPFWTHFDGYLIRTVAGQARLQALAGGDVRYGGLYELLAVGREYDSDHLLARFAVVQRARMAAW
jgi:hypothetical protein